MNPILVVDDATTVRMYHRKTLGDAGWVVSEAVNGAEALERVLNQPADQPFALFVVDVNMPKMDGYRFVRQMRLLPQIEQTPVVMVSTESQARDAAAARAAGANTYLVKPVKPAELQLTVALLLGDAAAAQRVAQTMAGEHA